MYPVSPQAYDRAITVFSPDGRLFQVEYAKEAVKKGATAIGMVTKDGVVLVASKNVQSKLLVGDSLKKVFAIDKHIATTASGLIADARRLIDITRQEAQKYRLTYEEEPSVESIAREVCDIMQIYTQYGGIRPFGVALLVGGVSDGKPYLYEAEPSGAMTGYKATAIGAGKKEAEEYFNSHYKETLTVEEGIKLSIKFLKKLGEVPVESQNIEIAISRINDSKFIYLNDKEVKKYL